MRIGSILLSVIFNGSIIAGLHYLQTQRIEQRLKRLKQEMQEMEDLVVAIVTELEETTKLKLPEFAPVVSPVPPPLSPDSKRIIPKPPAIVSSPEPSPEPSPKPSPAPEILEPPVPQKAISDPKHQKIIELWCQGCEISEIANRLMLGPSEIRLVIGLYK